MFQQDTPKDSLINMRIHSGMRDFIDYAAHVSGKGRSDFMLEAACEKAEEVLLDRRLFFVDSDKWDEFNQILDNPPQPNNNLKKLLSTSPPWDK